MAGRSWELYRAETTLWQFGGYISHERVSGCMDGEQADNMEDRLALVNESETRRVERTRKMMLHDKFLYLRGHTCYRDEDSVWQLSCIDTDDWIIGNIVVLGGGYIYSGSGRTHMGISGLLDTSGEGSNVCFAPNISTPPGPYGVLGNQQVPGHSRSFVTSDLLTPSHRLTLPLSGLKVRGHRRFVATVQVPQLEP